VNRCHPHPVQPGFVRAQLVANGGFQLMGTAAELGAPVRADNQRFKALMTDLKLVPPGPPN
jgi:hypothetical protein